MEIIENDYGDEYWYGGEAGGTVRVGGWVTGWRKDDPASLARARREAALIRAALSSCDDREDGGTGPH